MPDDPQNHVLADPRIRAIYALVSGIIIAAIGVLFFDGIVMWLLIGLAVFDVIFTLYILGRIFDNGDTADQAESI